MISMAVRLRVAKAPASYWVLVVLSSLVSLAAVGLRQRLMGNLLPGAAVECSSDCDLDELHL